MYQPKIYLKVIFILVFIVLGVIGLISIFIIHKASCMKNAMMKYSEIYLQAYIQRAIELGVILENDLINAERELNPKRNTNL